MATGKQPKDIRTGLTKEWQAVVVFGDPFNGAPIKGYSGPIQTYCAQGDDVCEGEFEITAAHLAYVGMDTDEAVAYIQNIVSA